MRLVALFMAHWVPPLCLMLASLYILLLLDAAAKYRPTSRIGRLVRRIMR